MALLYELLWTAKKITKKLNISNKVRLSVGCEETNLILNDLKKFEI